MLETINNGAINFTYAGRAKKVDILFGAVYSVGLGGLNYAAQPPHSVIVFNNVLSDRSLLETPKP